MVDPAFEEIEETNNGFTYKYYQVGSGRQKNNTFTRSCKA